MAKRKKSNKNLVNTIVATIVALIIVAVVVFGALFLFNTPNAENVEAKYSEAGCTVINGVDDEKGTGILKIMYVNIGNLNAYNITIVYYESTDDAKKAVEDATSGSVAINKDNIARKGKAVATCVGNVEGLKTFKYMFF